MLRRLLTAVLPVLALSACASEPAVILADNRFRVEIADDDSERARGLMFREQLARDAGMLFIFENSAPRSFYMLNCKIPLDILFFDEQLELINIHRNVPPCRRRPCPTYRSEAPARYVLELAGNRTRELDLGRGSVLELEL